MNILSTFIIKRMGPQSIFSTYPKYHRNLSTLYLYKYVFNNRILVYIDPIFIFKSNSEMPYFVHICQRRLLQNTFLRKNSSTSGVRRIISMDAYWEGQYQLRVKFFQLLFRPLTLQQTIHIFQMWTNQFGFWEESIVL